ncbi:MAG: hypothetical protein QM703_28485 [Gemmatales bacterium]
MFSVSGNVAYIPTEVHQLCDPVLRSLRQSGDDAGARATTSAGLARGNALQYNAAGFPLVYSPEWTLNITADINLPFGDA